MRRSPKVEMAYGDEDLKPKKLRDDEVLRAAALPKSFKDYVASMEWMSPHYLRVRKLLAQSVERGGSEEERRRLRLNLERTRVLPGPWTRHVVVDSASGRLWYYQAGRSEEHTSELQSLMRISSAVFCLTKTQTHDPTL